jgi:hypothetical protein
MGQANADDRFDRVGRVLGHSPLLPQRAEDVRERCKRRQTGDERSPFGGSGGHRAVRGLGSGLASTRSRGSDERRRPACPLRRKCASARVGQGVHDLAVELVDPAPSQQAVGDRALKRRARLVEVHIQLPAHELQAGLSSSATASRTYRTDNTISPTSAIPARDAPRSSVEQFRSPRPTRRSTTAGLVARDESAAHPGCTSA